jgi:hypothetical protein
MAGETFWGRVPKFSIKSEEILSRDHGNFEEHNKVLESSIIIINYCIIINIKAYYNCIINEQYNIIFLYRPARGMR